MERMETDLEVGEEMVDKEENWGFDEPAQNVKRKRGIDRHSAMKGKNLN